MNILYLLPFITLTEALKDGWVDPHDMNTNAKQKIKRSFSENSKESINIAKERGENSTPPPIEENTSLIYLKRTVNLILNSAYSEKDNPNVFTGSYHYVLDTEEYKFLVDFSSNKKILNIEDIRRLDTVLSTLFSKSYNDNIFNFNLGITTKDIFSLNFLIMLGTTVCLFVMYVLLKNNSGFMYILSYFALLLLIVDYGCRYKYLYEEAEEHNLNLSYTTECDTAKMSWSEYFKFAVSQKNCEKKIVTPLDVGLAQLKNIIIIPLESVGTGMGKFGKELWEKLPFPWNILIFPIMLAFIIAILFIFVLAIKNTAFTLKLFHLLHLEFGKHNEEGSRVSDKTLDKILDAAAHRIMVEDTKCSPVKKEQKRIQNKNTPPKKVKNEKKQEETTKEASQKNKKTNKSDNENKSVKTTKASNSNSEASQKPATEDHKDSNEKKSVNETKT